MIIAFASVYKAYDSINLSKSALQKNLQVQYRSIFNNFIHS